MRSCIVFRQINLRVLLIAFCIGGATLFLVPLAWAAGTDLAIGQTFVEYEIVNNRLRATFAVSVTNVGDTAAHDITVLATFPEDAVLLGGFGQDNEDGTVAYTLPDALSPAESYTFDARMWIDDPIGTFTNEVTIVSAADEPGGTVAADLNPANDTMAASFSYAELGQILVTNVGSPVTSTGTEATVSYFIVVSNQSIFTDITIESINDDKFGNIQSSCSNSFPAKIKPQSFVLCLLEKKVSPEPGTEEHTNTVTAIGFDESGNVLEGSDAETVRITGASAVGVQQQSASTYTEPIVWMLLLLTGLSVISVRLVWDSHRIE